MGRSAPDQDLLRGQAGYLGQSDRLYEWRDRGGDHPLESALGVCRTQGKVRGETC